MIKKPTLDRWRANPLAFVSDALLDPETGKPFDLYAEEADFLQKALTVGDDGRLPYSELLFSAPKKSGKTAVAAIAMLFVMIVIAGRFGEGYAVANDFDQAQGRVFQACQRMVETSPVLKDEAQVKRDRIEFPSFNSSIIALACDHAGAAGANPSIVTFDELWGYTSENSQRLWDEFSPPPTRKVTCRLVVSYAGYSGESLLLDSLVKRGMEGELVGTDLRASPGMLAYITHQCRAPWQTPEWIAEMKRTMRPGAYLRLIENRFVSAESAFISEAEWDACCVLSEPAPFDRHLKVWIGVDASVKRDSTAVAVCGWDELHKQVRLIWHRIWQPSPDQPLDFENTIERALLDLKARFRISECRYDPYQMASVAQRLEREGVPMVEFPQTMGNLTTASNNLYELIRDQRLAVYPNEAMRLAMLRAVAVEGSRGWKISKEKQSHKIDICIALAQAALGCVEQNEKQMGEFSVGGLLTGEDAKRYARQTQTQRFKYNLVPESQESRDRQRRFDDNNANHMAKFR